MLIESISRIIDVGLGIYQSFTLRRKKRASTVGQLSMNAKDIGTMAIINGGIPSTTNRCHSQGIVVSANVIAESLSRRILSSKEMGQLRRKGME